jgi:hypothetical protein
MLWREITSEANQLQQQSITHRALDGHHRVAEEDNFIFEPVAVAADDDFDEYADDEDFDFDSVGDDEEFYD